jgi:hypothetical protein
LLRPFSVCWRPRILPPSPVLAGPKTANRACEFDCPKRRKAGDLDPIYAVDAALTAVSNRQSAPEAGNFCVSNSLIRGVYFLFECLGNSAANDWKCYCFAARMSWCTANFPKFAVNFPVSRNFQHGNPFAATAASATHCHYFRKSTVSGKSPGNPGVCGGHLYAESQNPAFSVVWRASRGSVSGRHFRMSGISMRGYGPVGAHPHALK